MSSTLDINPLIPPVTVNLEEGRQDGLALIARVATELRRANFAAAADAFEELAADCETADDLELLIRSTVTVL
jgi:hypothetical protein